MVLKLSRAVLVTAVLALAQKPAAEPVAGPTQGPTQDQPQEPIRVQVKEVVVPVSVTFKDAFVTNLKQSDFTILDQGKPQTITHFSAEPNQPVVVGFLLDLSSGSRTQWKNIQDAAAELVYDLVPGDKTHAGYLIGYDSQAQLMVDTTFDPDKIADKIRSLSPSGGSAMNDAIYMACHDGTRKMVQNEPLEPRRVIIIIGDGHDNASSKTLEEALELAQRQMVTVYAMSTEAYGSDSGYKGNLELLVDNTGGRLEEPLQHVYKDVDGFITHPTDFGNFPLAPGTGAYAAQMLKAINRSISNLAGEITTQYTLHYTPDVGDDPRSKRSIEVKVNLLSNGVTVRARNYYYPYPATP